MNILIINHYAGSPKLGMEFRPYYMAQEWIKNGHNVRIVVSSESHYGRSNPEVRDNVTFEHIDGIEYVWLKTIKYDGNGIKRFLNIFSFVYGLFRHHKIVLKDFKADIIISSSTYTLDIFPAHYFCKKTNAKLFFELHDIWPLTPMKLGGYSKYHPFILLLQVGEDYYCKHADKVVSFLPNADKHLLTRGMLANKFVFIPNGIKTDLWKEDERLIPLELNSLISLLKEQGSFIVGYTGAHSIPNALDVLLSAAKILEDKKINICFILIGNGLNKKELIRDAKRRSLGNVCFFDSVGKESIPSILAKFDALYIGWKRTSLYQYGISPNKLIDYMMSSKPIVHSVDAANDVVSDSDCGVSIEPENPSAVADAFLYLINLSVDERYNMGKRGHDYVLQELDYSILAKKFIDTMKSCL